MSRLIELILSWIFPVYWEIYVIKQNNNITSSQFPDMDSAINYVESMMACDTGEILFITMDKYINTRPDFLIKVNRYHKGWSSNQHAQ